MVILKHVGVLSAAKIAAVIELVMGFVIAVFMFIGVLGPFLGSSCSGRLYTGSAAGCAGGLFGSGPIILIALPIFAMVVGFIAAAFEAWLYNVVSGKLGGIKLQFKDNRLKNIDPISAAKIVAIIGAVFGFIIGLIITAVGLFAATVTLIVAGIISIVLLTLFFLIGGFIAAAIGALIYNFLASKIGGIAVYFKSNRLARIGALSYAKIEGIFGIILGLFIGILYFALSLNPMTASASTSIPSIVHALGAFSIVAFPAFYFVLTFLSSGFQALLYNYFARKIRGIEVRFS
jgi:hypothetical protein